MNADDAIKDNAIIILNNLKDKLLSPEDLTMDMRRVCVDYMDNEGIKVEDMAKHLCVTTTTIYSDLNALQDTYASMITLIDFKRVFGTYTRRYAALRKKALASKDYRLAWQMDNDYLDKLMEVGFIKKMPEELIVRTEKADEMTEEEMRVMDEILLRVAERRNKKENMLNNRIEGLIMDDHSDNGENGKESAI